MKRNFFLLLLALSVLPAGAASSHLVGQWTFSGANPFEAKIGADAVEGVGRNPLVKTSTTNTLYAVTDPAVLGDRTGVLAVPIGSGILIPVPEGLTTTYCLSFDFFVPEYKQWISLFSLDQNNNSDGYLFVRNGTDIGLSQYNAEEQLLEVVNGGEVQFTTGLEVGATGTVVRVDGGSIRSPVDLRIALSTASRFEVSIPETAPTNAPVQFSTITRANGGVTGTIVVNVPENRSRTPGNLPILSCAGGIPDGFVELGTVPNPERTERLFFGYDGTDAETGTLRTGVWYRSRPILPLMILVR